MTTIVEVKKAQGIRLLDVFLIGPAMVYASQAKELDDFTRLVLLASGVGTVWYNGRNYMENERRLKNKINTFS